MFFIHMIINMILKEYKVENRMYRWVLSRKKDQELKVNYGNDYYKKCDLIKKNCLNL